jgi:hypothetical protein
MDDFGTLHIGVRLWFKKLVHPYPFAKVYSLPDRLKVPVKINMVKVKNRRKGGFIVLGMVGQVFHPESRVAARMRSAATCYWIDL